MEDADLEEMIDTVIGEIAMETRIFKKLYGFTVHESISKYNFRYIARLNEQVEQEPASITFTDPSMVEIIQFINNGEIPDIAVEKELLVEDAQSQFIDLLDIFDERGMSVLHKFEERGSSYYFCYDETWRMINDGKSFAFSGWVKPEISELHNEELTILLPTIISGCKFYVNDILHGVTDTQATNYDYMRWFNNKKSLMDKFPTLVYSTKENTRWQY
jgi:hypothetical protein